MSAGTWPYSPGCPQNHWHQPPMPPRRRTSARRVPTVNLANNLVRSADALPHRPAIRLDETILTYADLDSGSAQAAGLLRERGVRPGDRVAIMLPNIPEFAVVYYGVLRAGAVVVPMNPLLKEREVAYYLGDSEARLIFAWQGFADEAVAGAERVGADCVLVDADCVLVDASAASGRSAAESAVKRPEPRGTAFADLLAAATPVADVVDRDGSDTAVLLYTSGTTGQPKGAELTHANLMTNVDIMVTDLCRVRSHDVIFGGLPLFHSFGQTCGLNTAVSAGACLTLLAREHRNRYDVSALRVCVSGGAALPVEVLRGFEEAFGCVILEGYGLSETSPVASFNHPDSERKPGSIGTPIRGVAMRVLDEQGIDVPLGEVGEIAIRGHNVMKGYWRRADATAEVIRDGWFRTGDLARVDEDGYFFIVDRKKDLIIRGGFNVYPREIEEVLYEHPAVAEAAVVGVPDASLGEEVGAAVVLKPGAVATAEDIQDYVKRQVAAYKYPRHVWILDGLPKTPTGKILKREIRLPAREPSPR